MFTDRVKIGSKWYCYYRIGIEFLQNAESKCSELNLWLFVPENQQENDDIKKLLSDILDDQGNSELGWNHGAVLGLRKKNGKFVDSYGKEPNYRIGTYLSPFVSKKRELKSTTKLKYEVLR